MDERVIICRCRGAIRNAEAWKVGRWDWRWLSGALTDGVSVADIDAVIERGGSFLFIETKALGVVIERGQLLLLQRLARNPRHTVVILRGQLDEPEWMEIVGQHGRVPTSRDEFWTFVANWWTSVTRLEKTEGHHPGFGR